MESDMIFHAGDFTGIRILETLEKYSNVIAVHGNMDSFDISSVLPKTQVIEVDGVSIGLTHSSGSIDSAIHNARDSFQNADLIVFGHIHYPVRTRLRGVEMFNPGSPTERRAAPFRSFGIIETDNGRFKTRIVQLGA